LLDRDFSARDGSHWSFLSEHETSVVLSWDEHLHPRGRGGKFRRKGSSLWRIAQAEGGFTYSPVTGDVPKTGFAVSARPEEEVEVDVPRLDDTLNAARYNRARRLHKEIEDHGLRDPVIKRQLVSLLKDVGFTDLDVDRHSEEETLEALNMLKERFAPPKRVTPQVIESFIEKHKDIFEKDPNAYLGAWVSDGKLFLDVTTILEDREQAARVGRQAAQYAMFDLDTFTEITLWKDEDAVERARRIATIQGLRASEDDLPSRLDPGADRGAPERAARAAARGQEAVVLSWDPHLHPRGRGGRFASRHAFIWQTGRKLTAGVDIETKDADPEIARRLAVLVRDGMSDKDLDEVLRLGGVIGQVPAYAAMPQVKLITERAAERRKKLIAAAKDLVSTESRFSENMASEWSFRSEDAIVLSWDPNQPRDLRGRWRRLGSLVDFDAIGTAISGSAVESNRRLEGWLGDKEVSGDIAQNAASAVADRLVADPHFKAVWDHWSSQPHEAFKNPLEFDDNWHVESPFDGHTELYYFNSSWFDEDGAKMDKDTFVQRLQSDEHFFATACARRVMTQWNSTSNGDSPLSLLIQREVAQMFRTGPVWSHGDSEEAVCQEYMDASPDAQPAVQAILRAVYDETQEQLRDLGFRPNDRIRLFRGMSLRGDLPIAERTEGTTIKMQLRAASSWSTQEVAAHKYARTTSQVKPDAHAVLLSADVPVDRILFTPATGPGLISQNEIVVLGGGIHHASAKVDAPDVEFDDYD
jgi:hypothetical protein